MSEGQTTLEREARNRSAGEQREFERRQVATHYEHDPDIFALVLDSQLTYSTGIFRSPGEDLETAQKRKFEHLRKLLRIQPGEEVFDAGCGWGSILLDLAKHTDGRFYGVTLSAKQREVALERARQGGVADRVRVDVAHLGDVSLGPNSTDVIIFSVLSICTIARRSINGWQAVFALVDGYLSQTAIFRPSSEGRETVRRRSTS